MRKDDNVKKKVIKNKENYIIILINDYRINI